MSQSNLHNGQLYNIWALASLMIKIRFFLSQYPVSSDAEAVPLASASWKNWRPLLLPLPYFQRTSGKLLIKWNVWVQKFWQDLTNVIFKTVFQINPNLILFTKICKFNKWCGSGGISRSSSKWTFSEEVIGKLSFCFPLPRKASLAQQKIHEY